MKRKSTKSSKKVKSAYPKKLSKPVVNQLSGSANDILNKFLELSNIRIVQGPLVTNIALDGSLIISQPYLTAKFKDAKSNTA